MSDEPRPGNTVEELFGIELLLRIMREGTTEETSAVEFVLNEFCALIDFRNGRLLTEPGGPVSVPTVL